MVREWREGGGEEGGGVQAHMSERPCLMEGEAMTRQKPLILLSSMRCLRDWRAAMVSATRSGNLPSSREYTITRPLPAEGEGHHHGREE